jgi:chemotaxis protein CheD
MEIQVGMGEVKIAGSPALLKAVGIGSCVAVALYDRNSKVGSMVHVVLPCIEDSHDRSNPGRFADVAIGMMVDKMKAAGSLPWNLKAKIFGGGNMFPETISPDSDMDIGKKNLVAVREELKQFDIEIVAEDVRGDIGRTVLLDTRDGSVVSRNCLLEATTH